MNVSSRSIIAVAACVLLFASIALVASITTRSNAPTHCPKCGAAYQPGDVVKRPSETYSMCRRCTHSVTGPVSRDFSWAAAVEHWLAD